jgi:hypothetical protein
VETGQPFLVAIMSQVAETEIATVKAMSWTPALLSKMEFLMMPAPSLVDARLPSGESTVFDCARDTLAGGDTSDYPRLSSRRP